MTVNEKKYAVVVDSDVRDFLNWEFPNHFSYNTCIDWMIHNLKSAPQKLSSEKHEDQMNFYLHNIQPHKDTAFLMINNTPSGTPMPKPIVPKIIKRVAKVIV